MIGFRHILVSLAIVAISASRPFAFFSSSSGSSAVSAYLIQPLDQVEYFYVDSSDDDGVEGMESDEFESDGLEGGSVFGMGYGGFGSDYGVSGKKNAYLPPLTAKTPIYRELKSKTLPPIYTKPVVNYKTKKQDIVQNRVIVQPIYQQRLIEQPIIETRHLIQPVVRRIINQPIISPRIIENTELEKSIQEVPVVQPRVIHQDVVKQQLANQVEQNAPITNKATVKATAPVKGPTTLVMAGGKGEGGVAAEAGPGAGF